MPEQFLDVANGRVKILFICSRNRRRSLTAETIFKKEPAWEVRSAGTEEGARIKVTAGQLGWADVIVVMEKRHKERCGKNIGRRCRQNNASAFSLTMTMNLWTQISSNCCAKKCANISRQSIKKWNF